MTPVGPATAQQRILASRETVWAALEEPYLRHAWWPETQIDFVIGGAVSESWREGEGDDVVERNAHGAIDVLMRGHALGFRWQDVADEYATEVLITLRSYDGETGVVVSETGFGRFPDAAARVTEAQQGWSVLLDELAKVVANPPEAPQPSAPAVESEPGSDAVAVAAVAAGVASVASEPDRDAHAEAIDLPDAVELPGPGIADVESSEARGVESSDATDGENADVEGVGDAAVEEEVDHIDDDTVAVELPQPTTATLPDLDVATAREEGPVGEVAVDGATDEVDDATDEADDDDADESDLVNFDDFIRGAFGDDAIN